MKTITFLAVVLSCLAATSATARDYYYYDLDGTPYYIQDCDSIVNIQLDSAYTSKDNNALALDQPGLQDDYNVKASPTSCCTGVAAYRFSAWADAVMTNRQDRQQSTEKLSM